MDKAGSKLVQMDDAEFERLEEKRRRAVDAEYSKLPPKPKRMMEDWTEWRTEINNAMIDLSMKEHDTRTERTLLTSSRESKTPKFFKGDMYIHGNRVKDRYGGTPITEEDDTKTKLQKKMMESNFYLFGIPRVTNINKSGGQPSSDTAKQTQSTPHRRHSMFEKGQVPVYMADEKRNSHRRQENERSSLHNNANEQLSLHRGHNIQENEHTPNNKMGAQNHRRFNMFENEQNTTQEHGGKEKATSKRRYSVTTLNDNGTAGLPSRPRDIERHVHEKHNVLN